MHSAQFVAGTIYRVFLLSLIVAVLWVKGYLWCVFGIALFLFVLNVIANLPIGRMRPIERDSDDEDEEEEDEESDDEV
jgi:hypothetical protein